MTTPSIVRIACAALFTLAACSGSEADTTSPDAGSDQEDGDSSAPAPLPDPEPVWGSDSQRLELSSFNFWSGSVAYEISRERLSAEQLALLADLREIPTPSGPLGADYASYELRITDRDGDVHEYRAADENIIDSDEGRITGKRTIDYNTLAPFLETFDCMSAKEGGPLEGDAGSGDNWYGAAIFNTDPGCIHGIFAGGERSHSYRKWQIDEPGTYRLSVTRCFEDMRLHLYDPTGRQELASSPLETAPTCPELAYTFAAPGTYRFDLEQSKSADSARPSAGDARLRVSLVTSE